MSEARRFRLFSILHREQLHAALFVFFFLVGAGAGSLVGVRSPSGCRRRCFGQAGRRRSGGGVIFLGAVDYGMAFAGSGLFCTSVVGFLLLPGLFFLRGYMVAASAASLWAGLGISWASVAVCLGLPAALSTAALYLLCDDAFSASLLLFRTCSGGPRLHFDFVSSRRILIAAVLLAGAAGIQQVFVPLLFHI